MGKLSHLYTFGCQIDPKYAYASVSNQLGAKKYELPRASTASRFRALFSAADRFPAWLSASCFSILGANHTTKFENLERKRAAMSLMCFMRPSHFPENAANSML